jgi:hypothetical protein
VWSLCFSTRPRRCCCWPQRRDGMVDVAFCAVVRVRRSRAGLASRTMPRLARPAWQLSPQRAVLAAEYRLAKLGKIRTRRSYGYHHPRGQTSLLVTSRAMRLCQTKAKSVSNTAPIPTGANRNDHDVLFDLPSAGRCLQADETYLSHAWQSLPTLRPMRQPIRPARMS